MFWLGVLAVPAGALALALVVGTFVVFADLYARSVGSGNWFRARCIVDGGEYNTVYDRAETASGLAISYWTWRIKTIPGISITVAKYPLAKPGSEHHDDLVDRRRDITRAVLDVLNEHERKSRDE